MEEKNIKSEIIKDFFEKVMFEVMKMKYFSADELVFLSRNWGMEWQDMVDMIGITAAIKTGNYSTFNNGESAKQAYYFHVESQRRLQEEADAEKARKAMKDAERAKQYEEIMQYVKVGDIVILEEHYQEIDYYAEREENRLRKWSEDANIPLNTPLKIVAIDDHGGPEKDIHGYGIFIKFEGHWMYHHAKYFRMALPNEVIS